MCCAVKTIFYLTLGYFLQAPDNSNFFRFPLKVRVIVSRLYFFFVSLFLHAALFPRSPWGLVALPRFQVFQVALYPMRPVARLSAVHV